MLLLYKSTNSNLCVKAVRKFSSCSRRTASVARSSTSSVAERLEGGAKGGPGNDEGAAPQGFSRQRPESSLDFSHTCTDIGKQ